MRSRYEGQPAALALHRQLAVLGLTLKQTQRWKTLAATDSCLSQVNRAHRNEQINKTLSLSERFELE